MKGIYLIFILSIICQPLLFSQVVVKRNNQVSKEAANVNWNKEFTLFDYTTDEPIFPLIRNGQAVYKIFYASKEDLRPNYGEFSVTQVEGLKYYKFKNRETCLKFCLANKLIAVPTLTTTSISALTTSSATSGGNITSDGGANITARGVVWSTTSNPTISLTTKTSDGTGSGSFSSTLTNLTPKTTYYVRAFATNSAGTGYGNEITFITSDSSIVMGIPCPGTPTVKDIDGNTYNTVQIGTQCWTKENLRVTKYRDGSVIPLDESGGTNGDGIGETWSSRTTGARTVYGHSTANLETYGYLYNWYSVADSKGLCPNGWHVPSEAEWKSLGDYLGNNSGSKLADTSWVLSLGKPSNESGFSIKPGGVRNATNFVGQSSAGYFWSSSKNSDINWIAPENLSLSLGYKGDLTSYSRDDNTSGMSIRCVKLSDSKISLPNISTAAVTAISSTSIISGGTIYSDGGSPVTSRGVVWDINQVPTIDLSTKKIDYFGTGFFNSYLINLKPNTTYYLRAYATNQIGTTYGNVVSFTTQNSIMNINCPGEPTIKDIDGNVYNTVKIGSQCWIKENLKVTKYRDGTIIPLDGSGGITGNGSGQVWSSRSIGARTVYGHDTANLVTYGYLYNWYAAADLKGICPSEWHVPSDSEWTVLKDFLGDSSVAGGKLKTVGTTYWTSPNDGATNESGFSAISGGYRHSDGSFYYFSSVLSFFWSGTDENEFAWFRGLYNYHDNLYRGRFNKSSGASIRCLKDTSITVSTPTITTTGISLITKTSATSGGNITADGGASITARGIVWSTSTNPTIALSTKTLDGTGTGSYTSSLTNLTPKTTYYVRAYTTNSAGTGYGNEISFTTSDSTIVMGIPCPGTPTVKDIDGNTYNTVQIGTQCWTKENLRVTKYRDGTVIPLDESGGTNGAGTGQIWSSRTTGARTVYGHNAANLATYGYLYNWHAVADPKGLCPSGWYVPSNSEWTVLNNFLGGSSVAGGKMKATGTANWNSPNIGASNESGFTVLPGGRRYSSDGFVENTDYAFFWSSTEYDNISSFSLYIASGASRLFRNGTNKFGGITENKDGFSVRCIKDNNKTDSLSTLVTASITGINSSSATSGGYINSARGAVISARGVVWSTTPSPTIAVSTKTSNGSGTGYFTSTLTNLTPKTIYYIRAYGTNNSITEYGNEISFTTSDSTIVMGIPCSGTPTVKDIDGNTYNTVQIGTQCWTKENLRVTKYKDGSVIPLDESGGSEGNGSDQTWSSRTTGTRTVNKSTASNVEIFTTYGYLYNWYAVADKKGLCPSGWHAPSDSEWKKIIDFLGGERVAGGKLKSTGTTLWNNPNTRATNESDFSGLPGGCRYSNGLYFNIGYDAFFWSATDFDFTIAWYQDLHLGDSSIISDTNNKTFGASVRCLKDTFSIVSIPTLTTTAITEITTTSSTSGGNITSDGGASIITGGVVWSTSTNPTISLSTKTTDGTGTGSFSATLNNLTPKTTYYVRAYATNSAGTGYGNEISFITSDSTSVMGIPCPGTPTVKDIDGNTYNTVQIGTQCWTKENLRVTKYIDGSVIPLDESGGTAGNGTGQTWSSRTTGARTVYAHSASNLATYGYLYNWYATTETKGLCPTGWHTPTDGEWTTLIVYLGGVDVAGGKLKSIGTAYWNNPNTGSTNESGFSAFPGGVRGSDGSFFNNKLNALYWSTTEIYNNYAWNCFLNYNLSSVLRGNGYFKSFGASIRCLKDTFTIVSIPTLTTTAITAITTTSATSGGNITAVGGASIIDRGVVWSTSINPTIALTTKTTDGSGTGSFTSVLTGLTPKTTYFVRSYATNSAGTGYGNEISFTTSDSSIVMGIPCPRTPTVKDIDGNIYNTVQIGTQCWTKENLRVTKYRDGTVIPLDESGGTTGNETGQTWSSRTTGARTVYEHSYPLLATNGNLYNWYAATDKKGLCPNGWHVPSDAEWTNLTNYLGGESVAGGKMKTIGTANWNSPNTGATNEIGFSVLPGGYRYNGGSFDNIRDVAFFWSASEYDNNYAWYRFLYYANGGVDRGNYGSKSVGASVRCIRD